MATGESVQVTVNEAAERMRAIYEIDKKKKKLNFARIPLDDKKTWDMICSGMTKGVFQVEKQLGKRYCKEIAPRNIEEFSDVLSLIRPGCLEAEFREKPESPGEYSSITNTYIKVKHGHWDPEYLHPSLEPILKSTYSVLVYQEQIMRICTDFAGFNLKRADVMRKAVGKKKDKLIKSLKEEFIAGALAKGHTEDIAKEIFGWIEKFSGYGFNKCVAGNTVLNRGAANQHSSGLCTVEHLYKLVNDYRYAKNCRQIPLRKKLRSQGYGSCMAVCADGRIRPMPIKTIHFNGKKKLVRVTDNGGRGISCTIDHKFMCPDGQMRPIGEIGVGGQVVCHIDSYDDEYIYDYCVHKDKSRGNNNGLVDTTGRKNWGFIDGNWKAFEKIKAKNWNINYCQMCHVIPNRLEWHHIDGDRTNNTDDNLIKLCVSCHKKEDYRLGRNKRFDKGHKTGIATIVSIEEFTEEDDTYDVEMSTPEHNWVADGFVVSNSHGVCYALNAYRTAYAKAHHPVQFFKAMLTNSDGKQDSLDEIQELVHEARYFGIDVKPPCLKNMNVDFLIGEDDSIRFGLGHIKGVGKTAINGLSRIAKSKDVNDFLRHCFALCPCCKKTKIRSNVAIALIKSGAIDYLGGKRITVLAQYMMLNSLTARERIGVFERLDEGKDFGHAVEDLLNGNTSAKPPNKSRKPRIINAFNEINKQLGGNKKRMCIAYEKHLLGIPLSGSLVELYYNPKVDIKCANLGKLGPNTRGYMGVVLDKVKHHKDKNHNDMAFLTVSDETYFCDNIVVFASSYNKVAWILEEGRPVLISGRKSNSGGFIAQRIEHL